MLKTTLLHPDLLRLCARAGHHAKILIADGNYPGATKKGPNAELVSLQLMPGVPTVAQVLRALLSVVPVDVVNTMGIPPDDPYAAHGEPPAWADFRAIASEGGVTAPIESISKWDFYKAVESADHILTVQTADQALWANVLLTVGCRTA
jgi:L-fucose mutarotase